MKRRRFSIDGEDGLDEAAWDREMARPARSARQITSNTRGYDTAEEREADVRAMFASGEYNRFIYYRDTAAPFAVMHLRNPAIGPIRNTAPDITY